MCQQEIYYIPRAFIFIRQKVQRKNKDFSNCLNSDCHPSRIKIPFSHSLVIYQHFRMNIIPMLASMCWLCLNAVHPKLLKHTQNTCKYSRFVEMQFEICFKVILAGLLFRIMLRCIVFKIVVCLFCCYERVYLSQQ